MHTVDQKLSVLNIKVSCIQHRHGEPSADKQFSEVV
jgi:hypothetical protein